jgi:hypothetical protein
MDTANFAREKLTIGEALGALSSTDPKKCVYVCVDVEAITHAPGEPRWSSESGWNGRHHAIQLGATPFAADTRVSDFNVDNFALATTTFNFPVTAGFEMTPDTKAFWSTPELQAKLERIAETGVEEAYSEFHKYVLSLSRDRVDEEGNPDPRVVVWVCQPVSFDVPFITDLLAKCDRAFTFKEYVHYSAVCQSTTYRILKQLLICTGEMTPDEFESAYIGENSIEGDKHDAGVDSRRQAYCMCGNLRHLSEVVLKIKVSGRPLWV